ncbi:5-formyltetrahydrofolate cyclo-ligase [Tessaracoccus sp. MC1756]|uniref:5-formyltetrahydrofolate cyclo-ligase n=1 Tax=Tessaracoccus sp. MC1756 TaxID=2760311 RepID=UPI00160019BA|nr:5-formyltetrahydrofolate cyclo-ligase [Tessaracoccus sp. MC1756]MBB1509714.1 5-formyltetrahydrofolate cyclo-ligase [Tessaracoccus sp. MC1756]
MPEQLRKDALRQDVSAARRAVPEAGWRRADAELARHVLAAVDELPVGTAAVYVSRPGEPGTRAIIDGLLALGWSVLVPRLTHSPDWAVFPGWDALVPGWGAIPHPPGPGLGAEAIAEADLVLLPCLAVGRDGSRLGTGGGWYDRALSRRRPNVLLVALARSEEVVDSVPVLPHDVSMDGYATELGWVIVDR